MAIIESSHVFFDVDASSREEVLSFAAEKAANLGFGSDASVLLEALEAREAAGATGMANGFAIPHCKSAAVPEPGIIVLRLAHEVEWQTMDKNPVSCVFALFIPESDGASSYLEILSKVAVMLLHEDFCQGIKDATTPEQIVSAIEAGLAE